MPLKLSPLSKNEAKQKLNINTNKPILLITGGSLGAKSINEFIFKNIDNLTKNYYIIHLVGKNNFNHSIKNKDYKQIEFSNDMWSLMKCTDYAISRAGANTIIELLSNEILTIFIPLPKSVSRGDQIDNALFLEKENLSKTILQEELSLEKLQNSLDYLKNNANLIKNSIKNANFKDGTQKIINIILKEKST
jgi:UDP-N-acetylglucosamine--N-acetylmuramyl-(pentapeptide) pyrophosphoryl-undecaprenol N-acetylglucosamine transferase